jgi:hypothetical protein
VGGEASKQRRRNLNARFRVKRGKTTWQNEPFGLRWGMVNCGFLFAEEFSNSLLIDFKCLADRGKEGGGDLEGLVDCLLSQCGRAHDCQA